MYTSISQNVLSTFFYIFLPVPATQTSQLLSLLH